MQRSPGIILAIGFAILGILAAVIFYPTVISPFLFPPTVTPTATRTPTRAPTRTPEPTEIPTETPTPTLIPTATPAAQSRKIGVRPNAIVMDPIGSRVYVSDENGVIHVLASSSLRSIAEVQTGNSTLSWLAIHPSGDRLYATTLDGALLAFDTARFEVAARARLNSAYPVVRPIAISPDGARVYVSEAPDKNAGMVSFESRGLGLIARFGDARDGRFAAVTRAGNRLFIPSYADNLLAIYTVSPNFQFFPALQNRVQLSGNPTAAVLNRDESLVYVTLGSESAIAVINTASLQVVRMIQMPTNLFGAMLTPDGRRLIVTSNISDHAYVVDTTSNQLLTSIFVGQGPRGIAISPDSRTAYTANYLDGTVSVFNLP